MASMLGLAPMHGGFNQGRRMNGLGSLGDLGGLGSLSGLMGMGASGGLSPIGGPLGRSSLMNLGGGLRRGGSSLGGLRGMDVLTPLGLNGLGMNGQGMHGLGHRGLSHPRFGLGASSHLGGMFGQQAFGAMGIQQFTGVQMGIIQAFSGGMVMGMNGCCHHCRRVESGIIICLVCIGFLSSGVMGYDDSGCCDHCQFGICTGIDPYGYNGGAMAGGVMLQAGIGMGIGVGGGCLHGHRI